MPPDISSNAQYEQAPLDYIRKYYEDDVLELMSRESRFYQTYLKKVQGASVLNVGCGPEFYNDLTFFGSKPEEYIGIDINRNTIKFLEESRNPALLKAKKRLVHTASKVIEGNILRYEPSFRKKFDFIISVAVLGMFPTNDFRKAVQNIHAYLKLGGMFLDADWTDANLPRDVYIDKVRYRFYSDHGPAIKEQSEIIRKAGFRILKYDSMAPNKKTYKWGKIFVFLTRNIEP